MRTLPILLGLSLLTILSAPVLASDPCTQHKNFVANQVVVAGVFTGNCTGAYAGGLFTCIDIEWGVFTPVAGVGGHNPCSAMVYVSPEGVDETCEWICAIFP